MCIRDRVDPASLPVEADCVGESASPSSVHEVSAQPLTRFTRQRRPLELLKDFILSGLFDSYKCILRHYKDVTL